MVPERDPGRRGVREPPRWRHHRCVARRAAVWRVEGLGYQRQGGRRPLLRTAVHARAVTDGGGVMLDSPELTWLDPSRPVPDVRTPLPGPRARAVYERDQRV